MNNEDYKRKIIIIGSKSNATNLIKNLNTNDWEYHTEETIDGIDYLIIKNNKKGCLVYFKPEQYGLKSQSVLPIDSSKIGCEEYKDGFDSASKQPANLKDDVIYNLYDTLYPIAADCEIANTWAPSDF